MAVVYKGNAIHDHLYHISVVTNWKQNSQMQDMGATRPKRLFINKTVIFFVMYIAGKEYVSLIDMAPGTNITLLKISARLLGSKAHSETQRLL